MAVIKGTNVSSPVVPFNTADQNPSHEAKYGKGGYRTVADQAERDAIPAARREAGMLVYEQQSGKVWQLADGLEEWSEFVTSSVPDWADITNRPSTFPPEAHAASHGVSGDDPISIAASQVTGLFSGSYSDLSGLPTLGSAAAQDSTAFASATHASSHDATGADPISIAASQISSGELSSSRLPAATANSRGGVTIGSGLSIAGDTVSVSRGGNGTLLMLRMDGSLADSSSSGVTLTGGGGTFTAGRFSQAYSCDIANGPSSSGRPLRDLTDGDWTIEAWVYRPTSYGGYSGIVWLQNSGGVGCNFGLESGSTLYANNGSYGDAVSTIPVPVGEWTHVVVMWTGGSKKLFVNGAPAGNGSQQLAAGPYDVSVGWVPVAGSNFNSNLLIDEVRITRSAIYPVGGFSAPTEPLSASAGESAETRPVWSDDARLTDSRAPLSHASSHGVSGADPISIAASQVSGLFSGSYSDLSGLPTLFDGAYTSLTSVPSTFAPPVATGSVLGGVKQGSNVTIGADGTISVAAPFSRSYSDLTNKPTLGTAAASAATDFAAASHTHSLSSLTQSSALSGQVVTWNGSAWAAATPSSYTLPAATTSTLGGVIVGTGLSVSSGTVSVSYGTLSLTACVGNDSRLSDSRSPTAHNQAWSTITSTPTTLSGYGITDAAASSHTHALSSLTQSSASSGQVVAWSGSAWVASTPFSGSYTDLTSKPTLGTAAAAATTDFAAASHAHGSITNAGSIGSASGQIVVTTTGGTLTTAATIASSAVTGLPTAGTGATNYCAGNDSRLSDSREWSASTVSQADAEAGTATTRVAWTVLRVWQAIAAWWAASSAKTKLDGIAAGATANSSDATLLARANHTGTQAASTITGLGTLATQSGTFSGTSSGTNTGDQTITLTGDVTGSGTGSFAATLASTGVSAASYGSASSVATFTVDAKGRLTAAGSTSVAIAASAVASGTIDVARLPVGTGSTQVAAGNDSRFSDSRSPTAHKSSHATGGSDALTASDIGAAASSHTHALSSLTQSSATTGQVATWNGTAWAPATVSSGGSATTSASDLSSGTLADARLSAKSQAAGNMYLWSNFR